MMNPQIERDDRWFSKSVIAYRDRQRYLLKPSPDTAILKGMEARLARIESNVEHLGTNVSELRADLRDFRKDTKAEFDSVRNEFSSVRKQARSDFVMLFGAIITVALGMAWLMATGFGWIGG